MKKKYLAGLQPKAMCYTECLREEEPGGHSKKDECV